jgi:hypothetical protein
MVQCKIRLHQTRTDVYCLPSLPPKTDVRCLSNSLNSYHAPVQPVSPEKGSRNNASSKKLCRHTRSGVEAWKDCTTDYVCSAPRANEHWRRDLFIDDEYVSGTSAVFSEHCSMSCCHLLRQTPWVVEPTDRVCPKRAFHHWDSCLSLIAKA